MAEETTFLRIIVKEKQNAGTNCREPGTCHLHRFEIWKRSEMACFTFVQVVHGAVLCRVNDILLVLRENHTLVMYPEASLLLETISKNAELNCIHVQGQRMIRYVRLVGIPYKGCIAESDSQGQIGASFLHLMGLQKYREGVLPALPRHLFMLLLGVTNNKLTPIPDLEGDKVSHHLKSAVRYASAHLSDPELSVSLLADAVGISRSYLYSLFKKHMNLSPQQYIIRLRVRRGCDLLRSGSETMINNAARQAGYDDPLLFSKTFKAITGLSPQAYKTAGEK